MSTPRLLSNRYELGDTLGYGGMSEVHKGRDVRLGRDVAVKVLRADLARDPQFQERFRREAQNAAALNHPAIVAVYDTGEAKTDYGPLPYIVMEYVDGRTLRDIVKAQGPLSGKRAMEVMADVCAALDFSHRHGIIHRDVKPANVMITKTGAVKVMDFGIARAVHDGQAAVTQTAAVIGTAQYLSPEQARGEAVDARSDVYAAGCVLFELMTGQPPFTGDSPVSVAYQHVREEPPAPSSLNPNVTSALDSIVLKAMAKGPANRYQSAAEMRADLVRVLSGQRPSAPAVMTAQDRTALMGNGTATRTQVVTGRHRPNPSSGLSDRRSYGIASAEEEIRRRQRKRLLTIAGVVLACIVVLALAAWLTTKLLGNGGGNSAQLPDVRGDTFATAQAKLGTAGFTQVTPKLVSCQPSGPCKTADIGHVFDEDPKPQPGSTIPKDTKITLSVGTSPNPVAIPDVKGKSPEDAAKALQEAGFLVNPTNSSEEVTDQDADLVNKVTGTNPAIGTTQPPGTTVTLVVGKAPEQKTVPNVVGQNYDAAAQLITDAGFKVSKQTTSSNQPAGVVVKQTPEGNSKQKPGTTVTLYVSLADQFTMPSITGMTRAQAQQTLAALGWKGAFNSSDVPTNDITQIGRISDFDPPAGSAVGQNSTINIKVYSYSAAPTTSSRSGGN
ncbi:MAG: Stk1 family PASTA domain-containing Ser/Thr kinase [Kutzneria sp.]|nr:Stk1 family PASTA domain-containing Ser/Thr kinase [Kutzneria sp.]